MNTTTTTLLPPYNNPSAESRTHRRNSPPYAFKTSQRGTVFAKQQPNQHSVYAAPKFRSYECPSAKRRRKEHRDLEGQETDQASRSSVSRSQIHTFLPRRGPPTCIGLQLPGHVLTNISRGNGTSMISLIIPPKDQVSRAAKMLAEEFVCRLLLPIPHQLKCWADRNRRVPPLTSSPVSIVSLSSQPLPRPSSVSSSTPRSHQMVSSCTAVKSSQAKAKRGGSILILSHSNRSTPLSTFVTTNSIPRH